MARHKFSCHQPVDKFLGFHCGHVKSPSDFVNVIAIGLVISRGERVDYLLFLIGIHNTPTFWSVSQRSNFSVTRNTHLVNTSLPVVGIAGMSV